MKEEPAAKDDPEDEDRHEQEKHGSRERWHEENRARELRRNGERQVWRQAGDEKDMHARILHEGRAGRLPGVRYATRCGEAACVRLPAEGVGDEGFAVEVMGGVEGFVAGGFEGRDGGVEFAGGDLCGGGVDVAELAGGEVGFAFVSGRLYGRPECPADDGAMRVEVAGAGGGVEYGTGFVVGELFPPQRAKTARWGPRFEEGGGLLVFGIGEDAIGGEVAGVASSRKPGVETGEGGGDAGVDAGGAGGVGLGEGSEAFAKTGCVLLRDGEDANAALRAAGAADEVRAAAESGGGEGGGYDLDEVGHGITQITGSRTATCQVAPHLPGLAGQSRMLFAVCRTRKRTNPE